MPFVEAEVTQVVGRRPLAGSAARLGGGQGQVGEMVGQGAQALHDVVEGPIRRGSLQEVVVQCLDEKKNKASKVLLVPSDVSERYFIAKALLTRLILMLAPAHVVFFKENTHLEPVLEA